MKKNSHQANLQQKEISFLDDQQRTLMFAKLVIFKDVDIRLMKGLMEIKRQTYATSSSLLQATCITACILTRWDTSQISEAFKVILNNAEGLARKNTNKI